MDTVGWLQTLLGAALVAAAWLMPRRLAGAAGVAPAALLLDIAPPVVAAVVLGCATGRPVFAGSIVFALSAGFVLADHTMRQTLREPVVFSEAVELPQVFTHPHLYLPFAGSGLVLGGAAAGLLLALALLVLEPPLWAPQPATALGALGAIAGGGWLVLRAPLLARTAGALRRLAPSGEPWADAAALGPFAMLAVHTIVARAERPARRRALAVRSTPSPAARQQRAPSGGPLIIVQCESFFDARRLSPRIPREFLAAFQAGCAAGRSGRLAVPGWGANTMRSEFAVLTGIAESELGYDRFNPYYALARTPLESQVWRLRRAGYRTICLHPFSRRFFRRDLVMPALGFERFLGRETLGGSRTPPYCPDPDLAEHILRVLDEAGPQSFIFAITMGNHGPWPAQELYDPAVHDLFEPAERSNLGPLLRYLAGLRQSDEMLRLLMRGLERRGDAATLVFYGDHQPSLPAAFDYFGFTEPHSDYVVWRGGAPVRRQDLAAHELGRLAVDDVLEDREQQPIMPLNLRSAPIVAPPRLAGAIGAEQARSALTPAVSCAEHRPAHG